MRQIEFLEPVKLPEGQYAHGDRVTLPTALANLCISKGWAKCVSTGETGERKSGAQTIDPDKLSQVFA